MTVKIDEVGSAKLALKPTATLNADFQGTCAHATLNAGLTGQLSATVGLQLGGHTLGPAHTFGPKQVVSKSWPSMWSGEIGC